MSWLRDDEIVHLWLRKLMNELRMNQKDLSNLWGADPAQVSRFMTGNRRMSHEWATRLRIKTGLTVDEIFKLSDRAMKVWNQNHPDDTRPKPKVKPTRKAQKARLQVHEKTATQFLKKIKAQVIASGEDDATLTLKRAVEKALGSGFEVVIKPKGELNK